MPTTARFRMKNGRSVGRLLSRPRGVYIIDGSDDPGVGTQEDV
jgi:hypothetical protein